MLRIDDIHVHYGQLAALRGISLEVGKGEIVTIVGPNGAGKSTLLLTVSGVLTPTKGAVFFNNELIVGAKPEKIVRKGISLVPEGRHVFTKLTVEENLRLGMNIRKDKKEAEKDFEKVLESFPKLKDRLKSSGGGLSGGEQQMLVIGRALITKPKLMTVDEPSLGLSPNIVDNVWEILKELREKNGLTLLIVEQSTDRAIQASDRIIILRNGRIQLSGLTAELSDGKKIEQAYFGFEEQMEG